VPLDLATQCVDEVITRNPDLLAEQTKLTKDEILDLIKFCLTGATYSSGEVKYLNSVTVYLWVPPFQLCWQN